MSDLQINGPESTAPVDGAAGPAKLIALPAFVHDDDCACRVCLKTALTNYLNFMTEMDAKYNGGDDA